MPDERKLHMARGPREPAHLEDREQMELSDLLSRVLDKGVVIAGEVLLSVADIDLVKVGVMLILTSVESEETRKRALLEADADASLLPPAGE